MREKADRETLGIRGHTLKQSRLKQGRRHYHLTLWMGQASWYPCLHWRLWLCMGSFKILPREIYYLLEEDNIRNEEHRFTDMYCKEVIWAIHMDKCMYFNYQLIPEDFAVEATPRFKKSLLWEVIHKLQLTNPIDPGTFPTEWKQTVRAPEKPPGIYNPAPPGPPPTFNQTGGARATQNHHKPWRRSLLMCMITSRRVCSSSIKSLMDE